MRSIASLIAFAIIPVVMIAWAHAPAFAADGGSISAGPIFEIVRPYIVEIVSGAVLALLTWVAALFQRWTGIQIEARHRDALHSAAMTGVSSALTKAGYRLNDLTVSTRSYVLTDAANWVVKSVPDAVTYFGLGPDKVAAIVESKLGQLIAGVK